MARIIGTDGNDTLIGWSAKRTERGQTDTDPWSGRDDLIDARGGDDSVDGGDGHDLILGGPGRDTLAGGRGADTILPGAGTTLPRAERNFVDGGAGRDWVSYEKERAEPIVLSLDGGFSNDALSNVENLRGGAGTDRLAGDSRRNVLEGLGGQDTLIGGRGSDTLHGGDETGLGDILFGGAGNDSIEGGRGFDLLDGGVGDDTLSGGDSGDQLFGGNGDDVIRGGLGADTISGGKGADLFVYGSAAEGGDLYLDYNVRQDQVQISAAGFGGGLVAGQRLAQTGAYIESATGLATSAAGVGQFVYDPVLGVLYWDADGAGGAAAVVLFTLTDPSAWRASELSII